MAWLKKADQQQASDGVPPKPLTAETPLEVQNEFNKEIPEPVDEAPFCPACGGPGIHMGNLGNRAHFRCRDCGIDFSNEG